MTQPSFTHQQAHQLREHLPSVTDTQLDQLHALSVSAGVNWGDFITKWLPLLIKILELLGLKPATATPTGPPPTAAPPPPAAA